MGFWLVLIQCLGFAGWEGRAQQAGGVACSLCVSSSLQTNCGVTIDEIALIMLALLQLFL
jgi:hypothetical protein